MKKFIKFILVLGLLLLPCFSSASDFSLNSRRDKSSGRSLTVDYSSFDYACVLTLNNISGKFKVGNSQQYNTCIWNYNTLNFGLSDSCCQKGGVITLYSVNNNTSFYILGYNTISSLQCQNEYNLIPISSINQNYCTSNGLCPTCNQYTSLECQTEYNLIPISEVTANYCKLNFDLISPSECPSSGGGCSGSGESIVFSNVYVNNVLYPGGADIYLNVNELLATEISYNSQLMYIDVDYDGDQDYINGIIDINTYQPTSNDFTQIFVGGLVRLFPYIVIALFIIFVRKLIRKIFK